MKKILYLFLITSMSFGCDFAAGAIPKQKFTQFTILLNATTTGQLDATLTIESNDSNEGSCLVNLTALAKETCLAPVTTTSLIEVSNETFSSIDVTVSNVTADGYVAVIVAAGDIANAPETGTSYVIGDTLGQGTVGYVGNNSTFTIYNLTPNTEYTVQVYPYNNVDCINVLHILNQLFQQKLPHLNFHVQVALKLLLI